MRIPQPNPTNAGTRASKPTQPQTRPDEMGEQDDHAPCCQAPGSIQIRFDSIAPSAPSPTRHDATLRVAKTRKHARRPAFQRATNGLQRISSYDTVLRNSKHATCEVLATHATINTLQNSKLNSLQSFFFSASRTAGGNYSKRVRAERTSMRSRQRTIWLKMSTLCPSACSLGNSFASNTIWTEASDRSIEGGEHDKIKKEISDQSEVCSEKDVRGGCATHTKHRPMQRGMMGHQSVPVTSQKEEETKEEEAKAFLLRQAFFQSVSHKLSRMRRGRKGNQKHETQQ